MKLFNAEENKKNAGEAGAVKVILKVLSAYIEDSDVCKIYCSILDRMISNGKTLYKIMAMHVHVVVIIAAENLRMARAAGISEIMEKVKSKYQEYSVPTRSIFDKIDWNNTPIVYISVVGCCEMYE